MEFPKEQKQWLLIKKFLKISRTNISAEEKKDLNKLV